MSTLLLLFTISGAAAQDLDNDGYTVAMGDCDDNESTRHPGAIELAGDGRDQDCDGSELCFADADNDGARTSQVTVSADEDCLDAFEALATDRIDCDDTNVLVSPYIVGDICGLGDSDCDGVIASVGDLVGPVTPTAGAVNSWNVVGGVPSSGVVVVASPVRGTISPPACPSLTMGLGSAALVDVQPTDPVGDATASRFVPAGLAGVTAYVQGFFPATCEATCIEVTPF